jgi:hypothetical protein
MGRHSGFTPLSPFSVDKAKEMQEKLRAKLERIPLNRFSGPR